jgi:predicted glutamine amidotransferase
MCGIIYIKRQQYSPLRPLIKRFREQESRGTEGFGFVAVKDGTVIGYHRAETFKEIEAQLEKYESATEILFHHRYPTSTENIAEQAHPIFVSNPQLKSDYYVVHNGVLRDYTKKKTEHNALGFVYNTEAQVKEIVSFANGKEYEVTHANSYNDSEVLAVEFARWNEGLTDTIDVTGSVALVAYEVDKETQKVKALHFGRNSGNPLVLWSDSVQHDYHLEDYENYARMLGAEMLTISSESKSKFSFTIDTEEINTYDYEKNSVSKRVALAGTTYTSSYKGGSSYSSSNYLGYTNRDDDYGWTSYADKDKDDEVVGKPVVQTLESLFNAGGKDSTPVLDRKLYESMNEQELEWERLCIEDEQFRLTEAYNRLCELEETAKKNGVAITSEKTYSQTEITNIIDDIDDRNENLDRHLDYVEMLMGTKFIRSDYF